jgi:hypothetical protein
METDVLTPIKWPERWDKRSRMDILFENVPRAGSKWLLFAAVKAELRGRTPAVLQRWEPYTQDGFDCVAMVLKPIKEAGWPNHYIIPEDNFALLSAPLEPGDVLNEICLRSGVGDRGKTKWSDFWLFTDCLPRFSRFPENVYSSTVGRLVEHILDERRQQAVGLYR